MAVLARRLLVVAAVFLLLSTMLTALGPVERADRATKPPPSRVVVPAVEATGELPADEVVRARVGDVVVLDVEAGRADTVLIDGLGIDRHAAPDLPARLEFVATAEGRYPVVLELSRERLGTLVVTGPAAPGA